MCALKLECFTNDAPDRSRTISLFEGFESEKDIAFSKGVKSGAEAATKAFEAEKIRSLAPILEALNDIGFSQAEARHAALTSLRPLLGAIFETALPACTQAGFANEVIARVMSVTERLPDASIKVFVPNDAVASVTEMLATSKSNHAVQADATLGALEARIEWPFGFENLNISAVLNGISASLDAFFTPQETGQING